MKPLLGILNRSRRKEMLHCKKNKKVLKWTVHQCPISKVETVWRTVVAWRWSTVHLIRQIWPGRALLEERQRGYFHEVGNKGFDSPLIPHSCCCHATNFSSSLLLGGRDGPWILHCTPSRLSRGQIDSSCAFHISPISQSLSPNNTGPKCAQL